MYGKLFAQIYEGSLYGQWEALVTFQQMIVLADKEGTLDMTAAALAARTSIPVEIIERGIAVLEAPDPQSRTPDEDGRRIIRLAEDRSWGWRITNYVKYRTIRTAEERRDYMRNYQRKRRSASTVSTSGKQSQPIAEAEVKAKAVTTARSASWLDPICDVYERHYGAGSFPYGMAGKTLKPLREQGFSGEEIASRLDRYCNRLDDIRYFSLPKFRQTFGAYADTALQQKGAGAQMVANIMGPNRD